MIVRQLDWTEFLAGRIHTPVLDVRSEGEYAAGHVPGAVSLPLLDNDARAQVGTVYKQQGQAAAVERGLELIGPRLADLVRRARHLAPQGRVILYCWRGGMRSGSLAWLLSTAGFQVQVLAGGYRTWRQQAQRLVAQPWPLRVLTGLTGCGKTELLYRLHAAGEQVMDLEALAHHRGSAFGQLGLPPQPTTEQFENRIAEALLQVDASRPIWIEDESRTLGKCVVPPALFAQMRVAPLVEVQVPMAERVARLVHLYGQLAPDALAASIVGIQKKLGGLATQQALAAVAAGDLATAARLCLVYYDKSYVRSIGIRRVGLHLHTAGHAPAALLHALRRWGATITDNML